MRRRDRGSFLQRPQIISGRVLDSLKPYLAVLIILLCLWGMWDAGRAGLSRLFSNISKRTGSLELSDRAVHFSASDPEAHMARALMLSSRGESVEMVDELERATALRPRDFYLWIELGEAREHLGDKQGALAAYGESTRRAPYYANPRWYLGNLYLRAGRHADAFVELRRAYASDPTLLPAVIDLAWRANNGDPGAVRESIRPDNSATRFALESFFIEHGAVAEAVKMFVELTHPPDWERRELLSRLLADKRFTESFEVWSKGREASLGNARNGMATVIDGDFEGKIAQDEPGFGWQFPRNIPTVRALLDTTDAHAGSQSLRLEYQGDSDPETAVVSELVVVEPGTRYRLSFAARTKDLVTGGSPVVAVTDALDERVLMQSTSLPRGTNGWQDYVLDFVTPAKTSAVLIQLRRLSCDDARCPAFGYVWFDGFFMQKF
jgi:tetratricopeptide (TPR) repeat protein